MIKIKLSNMDETVRFLNIIKRFNGEIRLYKDKNNYIIVKSLSNICKFNSYTPMLVKLINDDKNVQKEFKKYMKVFEVV